MFYELAPIFQEVATKAEKEGKRERFIPNIKVEQFIKMVGENKHFINLFSAANGCGKCLPLDSPILMANGQWKKLGDIKKGDYVLGHDYDGDKVAVPSRVVETSRAGRKEVFKFYFRDGGYVIASKEHSFPLKFRSGRKSAIKKKRIEEVLDRKINYVGGKLKFQQPKAIEFKNGGNLPIHPYLLGALLGDGGLTGGSVRFSNIDERIIKKVRSICGKEGFQLNYEDEVTHRIVDMRNGRSKKGHFGQNRLVQHIKQLKLDIKSGEKFIPDVYKIASVEERKQLLAGLIDTDGTFSEYFTKSKRLAEDFVFLVRTLGGTAKLKERIVNNDFTKGEDALFYRIYWRFDYELPLSAPEKQRVSKKPVEYTNRFVVKVESVGFVECGDIAIEHPKHCYISYDFISTGNTAAGALIITAICFGNIEFDPFYWTPAMQKEFGEPPKSWFDYPLYNKFPFKKKGRIISDPTTIKEQIVPELKKWFPTNRYVEHWTTAKEGKNYECKFITDTGFEIDLMTTEQAPKEFESVSLGFCWIDEPCPHNIYMATIARGRLGMIIFLTMTPLSYSAWIKDEIFDKRDGKNIEYITATVWDNCVEMEGTRGILTKDNIEKMISQYPIDEREARIEGKFGHLLGRVHKKFDRRIHTIRPFSIKYDDFVVVMAHDTHPRVGDHISWVAIDRKGTKYVIDEMEITGLDHEMAANIKAKEVGWRVIDRLLDPSGWNEDKRTLEKTFAERMYDEGIEYKPGSKHLNEGIRRTNTALDYEERGGILIRQPELYFFNTCEGHIKQFENYVWDEWQGRNVDSKDPKGQPKDKNDHYPENIHRILLENYQFIESEKYEKEREQQESHSFHDKLERFGLISNPLA